MKFRTLLLSLPLAAAPLAGAVTPAPNPAIDQQFEQTVKPFVGKYCVACHSGKMAPAQFDLKSYTSLDMVTDDFGRWALLADRLKAKEMPPKPMPAPPAAEAQQVIDWVAAVRAEEIKKAAGDPGVVLARRLSNAEYDYTIRDLTGQDMHVAKQFPVDPANQAGFDNSGESLTMSPALLNKYLKAAREVADHVVLKPDGIDFAPYPMLVETDREKYAIQRIIAFYTAQPTDYADYFEAAWRYQYRVALKQRHATLATTAAEAKVSPKYLPMVWQILHDQNAVGPVLKLQKMWQALPPPKAAKPEVIRAKCTEMRDFVQRIRTHTAMQFAAPLVAGLPAQSEPLLNWKLKEFAEHRRDSDPNDLRNDTDPSPVVPQIPKYPRLHAEAAPRWAALSAKARANDTDLIVPAAQRARYEAAFARFAFVFPDAFYITERGRYFPDDSEDKGRLLSASYHNIVGYYRDDIPLMQLILDDNGKKELDRLWNEFDYIANVSDRTWTQYYFNQSGEVFGKGEESGSDRPTDHAVTDSEVIFKMRDTYLAKAAADPTNDPVAAEAIRAHFDGVNATLRSLEKERADAEARQLEALLQFAAKAYRRPLTPTERTDLLSYYHQDRTQNQLSHKDALRGAIAGVLMEPDYLYRLDVTDPQMQPAVLKASMSVAAEPLSSYALASRLSYFLWASMPDEELLRHAASNDLQKPAVLLAETRRMMKDARVRGVATEFTGNWLAFRLFETNNSVDRQRFPQFNNDLREAMFDEPVRYVEDTIQNNRSVLDLLYGDYTFVNPVLAKHYGIPGIEGDNDHWVRVDNAGQYGRGGLLPMSVFATQNSPGLRTSPVKRGNWVVQKVLGIRVPPPPPVVPELPSDESKSDLPIRQMLAQHHANPFCASCHERFDSYGLAYEGYGPIGDVRTKDLAGRPVDTAVTYPGGVNGVGFEGLRTFIRDHRQDQFLNNLSRKLLTYGLNRTLQLSDEELLDTMQTNLVKQGYGFDSLVETIVLSPQFRNRRMPVPAKPETQLASTKGK
jgi:mono/diheme cytochrome c family protein